MYEEANINECHFGKRVKLHNLTMQQRIGVLQEG